MKDDDIKTVSAEKALYDADPPPEVRALRGELEKLHAEIDELKAEQGTVHGIMRNIAESIAAIPAPKLSYEKPTKKRVRNPVSLVLHNCDWHMGAIQSEDEIEGFNEFSPDILRDRILKKLVPALLRWTELHRSTYTVDECVIIVTMDLISGDIHDELRVTNAWPIPRQAVEAGNLFAQEVSLLSPHFEKVRVELITVDNHGRLTRRPQHKEGGYNTINYPLAVIAKELLRVHSNVTFNIYPKEQQIVEVKGRRYLLVHGHQVRGWAGFPYYGLQRKAGREALKRMRRGARHFDRIILGHWHAPLQHPWYWIGGSASGTDAYDHSNGREAAPIQCAWFVHPKHGEFDRTDWALAQEKL